MSIFEEPKIDCHCHLLDPAHFPYVADAHYFPAGQEIATLKQMEQVFEAYGVRHALIVQPNSGYTSDTSCLLHALDMGEGRYRGVAVVAPDMSEAELADLKARGVVGVAFNLTLYGPAAYLETQDLLARLERLDMFLQVQVQDDQLLALAPLLDASGVRLLFDHCGRPAAARGLGQAGFQKLLDYGRAGRSAIKISGYSKFSAEPHPHGDARPFVEALLDDFGSDNCLWASDWPFLRAPERIDYGPLLKLAESLIPDPDMRRRIFWENPMRLFQFGSRR